MTFMAIGKRTAGSGRGFPKSPTSLSKPFNTMVSTESGILLRNFYKKIDDPQNHQEYANFFTPEATVIWGSTNTKVTKVT